ncbi:MAG TPA: cation transporter [Candidatus Dormibacteraeota bacterium]|nr:cation transporter [Candidatus Dormibacteraeota bacterium]
MNHPEQTTQQRLVQRVYRIQIVTIVWMLVEAAGSLAAAWMAGSAALLAFGGDSAIELLSAAIVLWRFRSAAATEHDEQKAALATGALLIVLTAYIIAISILKLIGHGEAAPSYLGIAILSAAAAFMPLLARTKRKLSTAIGSATLRADAAESSVCGYLSLIALTGLVLNAVWGTHWADPAAALAITPLILREAREALRGKPCGSS